MAWTQKQIDALRKLFADNKSFSEIAAACSAIGPTISRNAAIGKAHRLGLSGRKITDRIIAKAKPPRPDPAKRRPAARQHAPVPRAHQHRAVAPHESLMPPKPSRELPAYDLAANLARRLGVADLEFTSCRWPIGEIDGDCGRQHIFCAEARENTEAPYCCYHRIVGTVPPPDRRRQRDRARDEQYLTQGRRRPAWDTV